MRTFPAAPHRSPPPPDGGTNLNDGHHAVATERLGALRRMSRRRHLSTSLRICAKGACFRQLLPRRQILTFQIGFAVRKGHDPVPGSVLFEGGRNSSPISAGNGVPLAVHIPQNVDRRSDGVDEIMRIRDTPLRFGLRQRQRRPG